MTDRTHPEAGSTHIIRYALELGLLWIDGDGRDKVREALDALDALEAQLEAIGAGGVNGPLMGHPQAMPHWVQYDERTDVLTIHGKRYAAGMFGEDGFLSPPGTWLRVCVGSEDCVTLTRASLAASAGSEPVAGMNEYGVRGYLAATLKCWHRLTGDEAAELVAMTQRLAGLYLHPSPPEGMVMVPLSFVQGFNRLAHNYSLRAVPPNYYGGTEGDAFSAAYRRFGIDLAELRAMLSAPPTTSAGSRKGE